MSVSVVLYCLNGAAAADGNKPMDQFRVMEIPAGVELSPKLPNVVAREITYDSARFAQTEIEEFARTVCWGNRAITKFQPRTLFQTLRGKAHATLICEGQEE